MAARKKKIKKLSERQFTKTIKDIVKRHGKVRIVFAGEDDYKSPCSCLCKECRLEKEQEVDMRRRVINKKGDCKVAYKSDGYKKWSSYDECCFMSSYNYDDNGNYDYSNEDDKRKYSIDKTVKFMIEHDHDCDLIPVAIEYGKKFARVLKLK